MISDADGIKAVKMARDAASAEISGKGHAAEKAGVFAEKSGVFVTMAEHPSGRLRGCIGFSEPVYPLGEALVMAAGSAACGDPRFNPMTQADLDRCTVSVTVLSKPVEMRFADTADMLGRIRIGVDGLILEFKGRKALFLPQVPTEQGWNAEQTLTHLSSKAGLPPNAWKSDGVRIWTFGGEEFGEESPKGKVGRI